MTHTYGKILIIQKINTVLLGIIFALFEFKCFFIINPAEQVNYNCSKRALVILIRQELTSQENGQQGFLIEPVPMVEHKNPLLNVLPLLNHQTCMSHHLIQMA